MQLKTFKGSKAWGIDKISAEQLEFASKKLCPPFVSQGHSRYDLILLVKLLLMPPKCLIM